MSLFHKHIWIKIKETYAPPKEGVIDVQGSPEATLKVVTGFTTLLWECEDKNCRKLRKEEMIGKEVSK